MKRVIVELPEEAFSVLRIGPEAFGREMTLAALCMWYEMGRVSQSKAAELAGISRAEFLDVLSRHDVAVFQTTPTELAQELARG